MRHSYTSLSTFQKCPLLYKAKYIDKSLPWVSSPAMERGNKIHKDLEMALLLKQPSPPHWVPQDLWSYVLAVPHKVEHTLTVQNLTGKMDVMVQPDDNTVVMVDWKTGKYTPDLLQVDVYYTLAYQTTQAANIGMLMSYVDQQKVTPLYEPGEAAIERVAEAIDAVDTETQFLPKPGWYCKGCGVTQCQYRRE